MYMDKVHNWKIILGIQNFNNPPPLLTFYCSFRPLYPPLDFENNLRSPQETPHNATIWGVLMLDIAWESQRADPAHIPLGGWGGVSDGFYDASRGGYRLL